MKTWWGSRPPRTLRLNVASSVGGFATALGLARNSDLVATVPELHTAALRVDLFGFPLPVCTTPFTISMIWHPRLSADPVHHWLRACLRDVCLPAQLRFGQPAFIEHGMADDPLCKIDS